MFIGANVKLRQNAILHHCTKLRKDWPNHFEDIAIFVIFKMAAAAVLDFQKFENFNGQSSEKGQ